MLTHQYCHDFRFFVSESILSFSYIPHLSFPILKTFVSVCANTREIAGVNFNLAKYTVTRKVSLIRSEFRSRKYSITIIVFDKLQSSLFCLTDIFWERNYNIFSTMILWYFYSRTIIVSMQEQIDLTKTRCQFLSRLKSLFLFKICSPVA